jgi:SpoIID/LytB domain protein
MVVAPTHRASSLQMNEGTVSPDRPTASRRRLALASACLLALLVAAGMLPAAVQADGRAAGPTTLGNTVTFHGRGYGHGVGMSQHGARGRALEGQTADEILAHYYQGTTQGTIPLDTRIRVRVLKDFKASSSKPLVLYARRTAWTIDGVKAIFPKDARVEVRPTLRTTASGTTATWRIKVFGPDGALLLDRATSHFRMRGVSAGSILQVKSKGTTKDKYRGVLRAVLSKTSRKANVVNELTMERYLRGVVPAEMPSTWPTEALKAQSIAARSYAARRLRPGVSWYDTSDDTSSQVYLGYKAEKSTTTAAINTTAGVVLRNGSAVANTLFHSTAGGATENNENVFVSSSGATLAGPVSYLRGVSDRRVDGTSYDAAAPYATWATATYARSTLSAWFAADPRTNVGSLTALDLTARGVSGRLIRVTLIGSKGTKTVSGDVFRAVFNAARPAGAPMMRSTLVDIAPIP